MNEWASRTLAVLVALAIGGWLLFAPQSPVAAFAFAIWALCETAVHRRRRKAKDANSALEDVFD